MDLLRVCTDEVVVRDFEGNIKVDKPVQIYKRDAPTTLATVYDDPVAGAAIPQPCLLTDERGIVRLNTGGEAWVDQWSYNVKVTGGEDLRWEAISGRGARPAGPADGTGIAGEYPDEVISSGGGGGGGDVDAHNALTEGIHGIPTGMASGQGLVWDESENNWDAATLVTPAQIATQLGTTPKRTSGVDTTLLFTDVGGRVDVGSTVNRVVTVPLNTYPDGPAVADGHNHEVTRSLKIATGVPGTLTIQIAAPGVLANQLDGTEATSFVIANRHGSAFLVCQIASENRWLISGQIA
jgi:hypothetical protein